MKVLFREPRSINGVDYSKGTHEVPDALEGHWFFKACVVNGSAVVVEKGGQAVKAPEAPKQPEAPKASAPNYHEHMKQWESKADKDAKSSEAAAETATQEEAQQMVDSGEAQIPAEAKLDIKALRAQAKELGLKANGNAAEIAERINKHLAEQGGAAAQ